MNDARLSNLLDAIQRKLLSSIPNAVRELRVTAPAYCLFIWYQDTSTDEFTPELGVAPVELRDACLSEKDLARIGGNALDAIWRPQQTITKPYPGYPFPRKYCENVSAESNEVYSILTSDDRLAEEGGEEGELLLPFRTTLQNVARELNKHDWSGILPHTDDFVVLAADYVGYWLGEDMVASVREDQLQVLSSRGFM